MLKKVLLFALIAGVTAAPAHADRVLLMPGVTYERQVQFTSHGPVAVHVINAPKPGGLWALKPVLSNGAIVGRERVTQMQRALAPVATAAGVNGDLFAFADGRPNGVLMQNNVLKHPPLSGRSSIGIGADGSLRVERVQFFGTWKGIGQRRPLALNKSPNGNGVALFTPDWGPATPPNPGAIEAVIHPLPPTLANSEVVGPVIQVVQNNGNTPIPPGGAVLVGKGTQGQRLAAEAPVGTNVIVRLLLNPSWAGVPDAIGGGPALVRDAKPIFRANELFTTAQMARNARTGVGQTADGRILLVAVDGRQPGYSVGMTNFELAQTLVRLGAVTGSALDAGGSTAMAFDGDLLNRPSDAGGERTVSEGLFVLYSGVYAPPPAEEVLSPNGDGVAEAQNFSYKLVRASTVTASLIGPDRVSRPLDSGTRGPGTYRFPWAGVTASGAPEVEGRWRFTVTAVDDQGQTSTADRLFWLNRTLSALAVSPTTLRVGGGGALRAMFTLGSAANVTATVETRSGAIIKTVVERRSFGQGAQRIVWNGRDGRGRLAHSGRYVFRVAATNAAGRAELTSAFAVRR